MGTEKKKLQLNILARENLQWSTVSPLQGELVTLLDASCFCQGKNKKGMHWSEVSLQTTQWILKKWPDRNYMKLWGTG